MLNQIRKTADNIIFRVILGIIVIAFCVWGIKDITGNSKNFTLVSFKNAEPIKNDEFLIEQAKEVMQIQKANNTVLSEDQIREYGISNMILSNMITQRLMDILIEEYDMNFSINTLSSIIRNIDGFKNNDGKFDIEFFKSYLASSGMTEDEYLGDVKKKLAKNILFREFSHSYYVPKIITNNIIDFLSEERVIDVAYIDLNSTKYVTLQDPKEEEIEEFYKSNNPLFAVPEKRSFSYVIIGIDKVKHLAKVSEDEAKAFLHENKDEIKNVAQAKEILILKKSQDLMSELVKNLEDEISAGSSIDELSTKFDLNKQQIQEISASELMNRSQDNIGSLSSNIFSMEDSEISYPLELEGQNKIAIIAIEKIIPESIPDLKNIKSDVINELKNNQYRSMNLKIMEDFVSKTHSENFKSTSIEYNISFKGDIKIKRTEIDDNAPFTEDMLQGIFKAKKGDVLGIYQDENNCYAVMVKSVHKNANTKNDITKKSLENIKNKIKEGVIEEIILHLRKQESPDIKQPNQ